MKRKNRFRRRQKGIGEGWKLLETLGFLSDVRYVAILRNDKGLWYGCGIRLCSRVERSLVRN